MTQVSFDQICQEVFKNGGVQEFISGNASTWNGCGGSMRTTADVDEQGQNRTLQSISQSNRDAILQSDDQGTGKLLIR